ncbi:hypothetical protein WM25_23170 [Burkholderia ubonensis]|nr:hypothetical protein WM25_23170 [Burkholderia ubonensis]
MMLASWNTKNRGNLRQRVQHRLGHLGRMGCEDVIQRRAGLVLLLVDELAAYAVPIGQRTDGVATRQRPYRKMLAFTPR